MNSKGELDVTPRLLSNKLGRTKKEKQLTRSQPRRPGRNPFLSPIRQGRLPRRQEGSGRERAARRAGGCARLCLARREAAPRHPLSASCLGSPETRARARLRECGHMAGPLRKGQSPRPGAPRTPGSWAPRADTTSQSSRGRGATGLWDPTRWHWGPTGWRGDGVLLFKKKIWVREQDSSGDHSGPWHRIGCPSLSEPRLSQPRAPAEGTQPRAAGGGEHWVPLVGDLEDAEAHPERGLVTFHRRLASSPAQLCPPHEAIMASSVPRWEKAAARQHAGHGVGLRGEAAPDNQPHSHRKQGNARASPPAPSPTAAAGS